MNRKDHVTTDRIVIGIDSSTTSVKTIAFDKKGQMVATENVHLEFYSPQAGYYEQDANDWWNAVKSALKKLTARIDPANVDAVSITNQRETFVPVDANGDPLRPAIIWLDQRCRDDVEQFAGIVGKKRIHRITGKPVDYAPVVYRLAWMKKKEPVLYKKIGMICDVSSFLINKLTGCYHTSRSSADPLGLYDMKEDKWSKVILDKLELGKEQLPVTYKPGLIVGKVTEESSILTGLKKDTTVIACGGDGQAAGLGSNVLETGKAYLNLGTAVVAGIYSNEYKTSDAFRTMGSCSEKGYYYECSLRAGTFAVDWFIEKILHIDTVQNDGIYEELQEEAEQIKIGCNGLFFVPYLCGVMNPYWNVNARGSFTGLSSSHTRGHMYRAILEGIAFEQLLATESVEKDTGCKVKEFITIGGGSKSEFWCRMFSDITGKNIILPNTTEASSLGAAIAAAVGAGWYGTFEEAADKMSSIKKVIKPDMGNNKIYREFYNIYKKIYPALNNISR